MTMTLTETLKQREADRRSDAARRHREALAKAATLDEYRALLSRDGEPGAGDADALTAVMGTLGITLEDVTADLAAVRRVRAMEARVLTRDQLDAAAAEYHRANAAVVADQRATLRQIVDDIPETFLQAAVQHVGTYTTGIVGTAAAVNPFAKNADWNMTLLHAQNAYTGAVRGHENAVAAVAELRRANPRVFGEDVA